MLQLEIYNRFFMVKQFQFRMMIIFEIDNDHTDVKRLALATTKNTIQNPVWWPKSYNYLYGKIIPNVLNFNGKTIYPISYGFVACSSWYNQMVNT